MKNVFIKIASTVLMTALLITSMVLIVKPSYDNKISYNGVGVITKTNSRRTTNNKRVHYVYIDYEGEQYKIRVNSSIRRWSKERTGKDININIYEYIKNGEIIKRTIVIDNQSNDIK